MFVSYATRNEVLERIRRLFGAPPSQKQAAALPWRLVDGQIQVLLVTSRGTGRWVLPKGWPEGMEELYDTAAREASEEAGIRGTIACLPYGRFFYGKGLPSGLERRCEVLIFPLEVAREADKWPEMHQRERKWFAVDQAAMLVNEPDLGELILGFGDNPLKIAA